MIEPKRLKLANLPTKIEKLDRLSQLINKASIYVKRDDQTGMEYSGNKIRKLEFSIQEAIENNCDVLITCGGIQSNHSRATVSAAVKLGMKACVVLRSNDPSPALDGNYFLDKILGADVRIISSEDYKFRRQEIMEEIKKEYDSNGHKAYIIPEGASNGIGTFGYYECLKEIKSQEAQLGIDFDTVVVATGSGGTYAGLFLANKILNLHKKIVGINVCDDADFFKSRIKEILEESSKYVDISMDIDKNEINIIDGYVGRGYALSRKEELDFIKNLAMLEGIVLDPVYTGKAMYGLVEEMKKGTFDDSKNILFIHTGGLYGLFPAKDLFEF